MATNKIRIKYGVVEGRGHVVLTHFLPHTSREARLRFGINEAEKVFKRGLRVVLADNVLFIHPPHTITEVQITDVDELKGGR